MAKASNGLGKFSGKLGGAVFVIRNGKQIVREYNPRPSNPKSALQLQQRAKGNLAGRISSFVPKAAIFGLGTNAIARRARFNKIILDAAQVTLINNEYSAKVPWENVLFSEGSVSPTLSLAGSSAYANNVIAKFDRVVGVPDDVFNASMSRIVVMVYDIKSQQLVEVVTKIVNKPDVPNNPVSTNVPVAFPLGYVAAMFLVPMSTMDGSEVAISTDMATKDDAAIAASLSANGSAVVFNYGRSSFLGQVTYTPQSSQSAAPSKERKKE